MPDHSRPGPNHLRVVHIDDNAENRLLVRVVLEPEGYEVIDANDGLSGVEAAVREQPAIILLDVNLPGLDGCEVASLLRTIPALDGTPVIALTAYAMDGDRERVLAAGCDGYIKKPIDVDTFPGEIREFLRGGRKRAAGPAAERGPAQ